MDLNELLEKAKELAQGLAGAAKEKAEVCADQAKGLAGAAKAKVSILSEQEKIKKAQLELGKLYYRDYVVGEEQDSAEYLPWCQKIDEANELIAQLQAEIDAVGEKKAPEAEVSEEDFADAVEEAVEEEAAHVAADTVVEAVCEDSVTEQVGAGSFGSEE